MPKTTTFDRFKLHWVTFRPDPDNPANGLNQLVGFLLPNSFARSGEADLTQSGAVFTDPNP